MSNLARQGFDFERLTTGILCGVALWGCTDFDMIKDQLHSTPDAGAAGAMGAIGGTGDEQMAGSGGVAGTTMPQAGMISVVGGNGGGAAGTAPSCEPGSEGCACAGTTCNGALACTESMCRRVVCGDGRKVPVKNAMTATAQTPMRVPRSA